jgi:hypothetical protein
VDYRYAAGGEYAFQVRAILGDSGVVIITKVYPEHLYYTAEVTYEPANSVLWLVEHTP